MMFKQYLNTRIILCFLVIVEICDCKAVRPSHPGDMSLKTRQEAYLKQFGYMQNQGADLSDGGFSGAMKKFQRKWKLSETGQMNEETQKLMETPRCGCPDFSDDDASDTHHGRSKRYLVHAYGGWSKNDLTYNIVNKSSSLSQAESDDALRRALAEWSNVTPLTFTETSGTADLTIFFVSREHTDGYAFDGPGNVLAHAFFPYYGGDAHFDDDENWTLDANGVGIDLFLVGVHEFGHSLGLAHSDVQGAIMYPFYSYKSSWTLPDDDIEGIRSIYGSNEDHSTTSQPLTTSTADAPCVYDNLDAITSDKSGNIFVFHGSNYTLIDHSGMIDGFPRQIIADFPEIASGSVDAAVYLPELVKDHCLLRDGIKRCYVMIRPEEVYMFSGTEYFRYTSGYLESRRLKESGSISSKFGGIPENVTIDAAFTYDGTDMYFVSGDSVYKQLRRKKVIEAGYPKSLSEGLVNGLESPINDVFSLPTTSTYHNYFFTENSYQRSTNGATRMDSDNVQYPKSTSQWCRNNAENDLGFFKHHTVYIDKKRNRIAVENDIAL